MSATAALEISMDDLESLLERVKGTDIPERDKELLRALIDSYSFLVTEIGDKRATVERLRQLLFGGKTESRENVKRRAGKPSAKKPEGKKKKPRGHGRIPAEAYTGGERVKVPHESLSAGGPCPCCSRGKVYRKPPRLLVRIRGGAPFVARVYEQDFLRCGLCGEVFTATLPSGVGEEKFDETVSSMVAFLRYGNGMPMNRIEGLQQVMGVPFPSSTQWEILAAGARKIAAAYEETLRQAAQGELLHNDDTPMKILAYLVEERKRKERGEPPSQRTGIHTTGIVSVLPDGQKVVAYFTGKRHAGENLAEVLKKRASGLDPPKQMCDALDRNLAPGFETIVGNCVAHARRKFIDVESAFPREVEYVIDEFALVYQVDEEAKTAGLDAEERLRLHQVRSQPVMDRLKVWMEEQIEEKKVEPNSGLGQAIGYCRKRWDKLTLFLREPGAPLDNTICERALKRAILHRKNSLFYKTRNGAAVGDLYMTLIATAKLAGADPFDYLNELQRHAAEAEQEPAAWMPWNYRGTLDRSSGTA